MEQALSQQEMGFSRVTIYFLFSRAGVMFRQFDHLKLDH